MTNPLESFILSYFNAENIPWEAVESDVYDALLPGGLSEILAHQKKADLVRLCFDPEALSEHSGSRLLAVGDPALDGLFQQVTSAGQFSRVFLSETNCSSQNLESSIRQSLTVTSNLTLSFGTPRPLYFSKALFYFQITYLSDEKQQMLLPVGVDLHFGRIARNQEMLLDFSGVSSSRPLPYPDAHSISLEEGYIIAWNECAGKAKAGTAALKQRLQTAFNKESQRLKNYFEELREELLARREKIKVKNEDFSHFSQQLQTIDLEEKARAIDLQKKSALQTEVRLINVLWIEQLQIMAPITILHRGNSIDIEMVWDPKTHRAEPLNCPQCKMPTLQLIAFDRGRVGCPLCQKIANPPSPHPREKR
jgi:hypothetical protein